MIYVVVEAKDAYLTIKRKYEGEDAQAAARRYALKKGYQIWNVESYEKAQEMIRSHNSILGRTQNPKAEIEPNFKVWDWSKTNSDDRKFLKAWYKAGKWADIMTLHNDLELTDDTYCCPSYQRNIRENMEKALKDGTI